MRRRSGVKLVVLAALVAPLLVLPTTGSRASSYPLVATIDGRAIDGVVGIEVGEVSPPLTVALYQVVEIPADPIPDSDSPPGNFKRTLWGYEAAAAAAKLHQYTSGSTPPFTAPPIVDGPDCAPTHAAGFTASANGRGVAFDPLDGNLWNTHVSFPGFAGDGYIHKNTPPPACVPVTSLPFGDGPGGTIQDDIGALDVDQASKHIWAAGYQPVVVGGVALSFFYLVNRNNGKIIHSCAIPFQGGGVGNDTLAYARLSGLPGSGQYLITDAGEDVTVPNDYKVIDTAQCKNGAVVTPVAAFVQMNGKTGIDFEYPGLISTDLVLVRNESGPPFEPNINLGPWPDTALQEDISLCAFRAKIGGDGNDMCSYP